MCGIAGILKFDPFSPVDRSRLQRMRDAMRHRGPDDAGLVVSGCVGLGHRRLSIIDPERGSQPMANADRTTWIVHNGEIYNFRELRGELVAHGCRFETDSDTEVILRAYEVYGEDCVDHLRGMFAFVIWDRKREKLFIARDRLGIKPLYFARTEGEFLFASEIKAIMAAGSIRPALNKAILPEFLATRFVAGAETFFQGVWKLLPGRTLTWSPEHGFQQRRYWHLPDAIDDTPATLEEQASELRARLEDAVRCHLVSDVPIGLFLSGGVDSSGLAALMSSMSDEPIRTFAVGFDEHAYSELAFARSAAASVGAEHRDIVVSAEEFFASLPEMIWHEDEPIAFPSSVALNFVSRLASNYVKVVMTGEGADELFLGYNRYRVTAWNEKLARLYAAVVPGYARNGIRNLVHRLPRAARRWFGRSFLAWSPEVRDLFYENFALFPSHLQESLLLPTQIPNRDPYVESLRYYEEAPGGMSERLSHADMQTYLVELLMKQDQMSMAASIESRVPFLDHRFVEYAVALPASCKLRGWKTKAVLREAFRDLVPEEILQRRKMGFPVPVGNWLRGRFRPLLDEFVLGDRALDRGLFSSLFLQQMVNEHLSGKHDHGERLWLLINLEIWQRIFLEGEYPSSIETCDEEQFEILNAVA